MKRTQKQWLVQEFSQLTGVSVRTLHHYDSIGLLKPSLRAHNNYRLYSEHDLLMLERIVALKFFGFTLQQIKLLLTDQIDTHEHLMKQKHSLENYIKQLQHACYLLENIIQHESSRDAIEWASITNLIKAYDMNKEVHKDWITQTFSPDQLKQLEEWKKMFTEEQIKDVEARWEKLIARVKNHMDQDPCTPASQKLAQEWMNLVKEKYGPFEELKDAIWLAYKHNKIPHAPFDQELWNWLHKASQCLTRTQSK